MDSLKFYFLDWKEAETELYNMEAGELRKLIAFAHGYIEQHKKGTI